MLASGTLVNTMNDLPASALTGTVLERAEFETPFDRALVVQGTLAGLNIATYVTPVGALAGIIWFDILRKECQRRHAASVAAGVEPFDVVMPRRGDLVLYGLAIFLVTTAALGATDFAFVAAADVLLGPVSGGSAFGAGAGHVAWMLGCGAVVVAVVVSFRRVLAAAGVALSHLGDVVAAAPLRAWAARHRVVVSLLLVAVVLAAGGVVLHWAEAFHAREYGEPALFRGPAGFVGWLTDLVAGGFDADERPRTRLGIALPPALAGAGLVALVSSRRRAAAARRAAASDADQAPPGPIDG
jgi:hypothetical protein